MDVRKLPRTHGTGPDKDARTQGDFITSTDLSQPLTHKSWTLEGHLRAKIPCSVSLLPPLELP